MLGRKLVVGADERALQEARCARPAGLLGKACPCVRSAPPRWTSPRACPYAEVRPGSGRRSGPGLASGAASCKGCFGQRCCPDQHGLRDGRPSGDLKVRPQARCLRYPHRRSQRRCLHVPRYAQMPCRRRTGAPRWQPVGRPRTLLRVPSSASLLLPLQLILS